MLLAAGTVLPSKGIFFTNIGQNILIFINLLRLNE